MITAIEARAITDKAIAEEQEQISKAADEMITKVIDPKILSASKAGIMSAVIRMERLEDVAGVVLNEILRKLNEAGYTTDKDRFRIEISWYK